MIILKRTLSGRGVTRVFSYQIANHVHEGELGIALKKHEHPPVPVHLILPPGRLSVPKVRAFVDFGLPRLRSGCALQAMDTSDCSAPIHDMTFSERERPA
jgi:DNA-binding transcriptional LysR family regulator